MIRSLSIPRRLVFAVIALASCAWAGASAAAERACFFSRELSNWRDDDNGLVYLRVGVSDVYELKLLGSCPDLHWAETIGVETRVGSSQICTGLDVNLIVPRGPTTSTPRRCMATSLRKLTPDEVKALPAKLRP
jgi:hypothetical protein